MIPFIGLKTLFMMDNRKKIGKGIHVIRMKLGLKQDWLAKQLSLSQSQLCKIESGEKELTMSSFYLFAALLRVSPSVLMEFVLMGTEKGEMSLFRILLSELNACEPDEINIGKLMEANEKIVAYYEANKEATKNELAKLFKILGWDIDEVKGHSENFLQ